MKRLISAVLTMVIVTGCNDDALRPPCSEGVLHPVAYDGHYRATCPHHKHKLVVERDVWTCRCPDKKEEPDAKK